SRLICSKVGRGNRTPMSGRRLSMVNMGITTYTFSQALVRSFGARMFVWGLVLTIEKSLTQSEAGVRGRDPSGLLAPGTLIRGNPRCLRTRQNDSRGPHSSQ